VDASRFLAQFGCGIPHARPCPGTQNVGWFPNCCIERIIIPSFIEVIDEGTFDDCYFLAALEVSFCSRPGEILGFSRCTVISTIKILVWMVVIGRRVSAEDASVREIEGFTRKALRSFTFGLTASIRTLGGFAHCSVRGLAVPSAVHVLGEAAFANCCFVTPVDFRSRMHLGEAMSCPAVPPFVQSHSQFMCA
jgi:hypothetical protein